jgi:hypothetical protein
MLDLHAAISGECIIEYFTVIKLSKVSILIAEYTTLYTIYIGALSAGFLYLSRQVTRSGNQCTRPVFRHLECPTVHSNQLF